MAFVSSMRSAPSPTPALLAARGPSMGPVAIGGGALGELQLQVGDCGWAVPLASVYAVAEASPLTVLPGATAPLEGLARIADQPFVQVDLAAALGDGPGQGRQVAVVLHAGHWLALRVDRLELTRPSATCSGADDGPVVVALDAVVAALAPPAAGHALEATAAEPATEEQVQLLLVDCGARTVAVLASAIERVGRVSETVATEPVGAADWRPVVIGVELMAAQTLPTRGSVEPLVCANWGLVVNRGGVRLAWLVTSVRGLVCVPRSQLRLVRTPPVTGMRQAIREPHPATTPITASTDALSSPPTAPPTPARRAPKARSGRGHTRAPTGAAVASGPGLPPAGPTVPPATAAPAPVWFYWPTDASPMELLDPEARLRDTAAAPTVDAMARSATPQGLEVHCGPCRCLLPAGVAREVRSVTTVGNQAVTPADLAAVDAARLLAIGREGAARRALRIDLRDGQGVALLVDHVATATGDLATWLPAPSLPVTMDGLFDGISWDGSADTWLFRFGPGLGERLAAAVVNGEIAGWLPADDSTPTATAAHGEQQPSVSGAPAPAGQEGAGCS